jgi:hypothetical protein
MVRFDVFQVPYLCPWLRYESPIPFEREWNDLASEILHISLRENKFSRSSNFISQDATL